MHSRFRTAIRMLAVGGLLLATAPLTRAQDQAPAPAPMNGASAADPCNPCFKRCCKPKCQPACPPCIVVKGCPAPCATERVVTVSKPCGCTVDVTVKVPAGCEKVRVQKDGDQRIEVGSYGVHIDWQDGGKKLVVRYHI